jgi:GTP-binding protein HflX
MLTITPEAEKAILVGAMVRGSKPLLSLEESLNELSLLADTAGIQVAGRITQLVNHIDPATFVGSGKVKEIIDALQETQAKVVIFDEELSPRHQRELSKNFGENIKLLDRSALILDIFAQHASTREGSLQVELAQYEYRLPRLTRQWTHLARQGGGAGARGGNGGVGLRGPGETQLETDKREIGRKIAKLKDDLEQVRRHRSLHRAQRRKSGIPVVALVGYTNAGKSTLLNALSDANVYVADQLFATLDPTTRRVHLPSGREILITDTVGFIQKLPTTLIAAFRATLEEIAEADLLLHVVDITDGHVLANFEAVEDTLAELDVPSIPKILVWNKIDAQPEETASIELPIKDFQEYGDTVRVSAQHKLGLDILLNTIEKTLALQLKQIKLLIPYEKGELVAQLYQFAQVKSQEHTENGVLLEVELPKPLYGHYEHFALGKPDVQTL